MSQSVPAQPIEYAVATRSHRARVVAAASILLGGLVLIGFGGCFLIGVMIQLTPALAFGPSVPPKVWTPADYGLHVVLYVLAGACLVSGGLLVWRAIASLGHVIAERG